MRTSDDYIDEMSYCAGAIRAPDKHREICRDPERWSEFMISYLSVQHRGAHQSYGEVLSSPFYWARAAFAEGHNAIACDILEGAQRRLHRQLNLERTEILTMAHELPPLPAGPRWHGLTDPNEVQDQIDGAFESLESVSGLSGVELLDWIGDGCHDIAQMTDDVDELFWYGDSLGFLRAITLVRGCGFGDLYTQEKI